MRASLTNKNGKALCLICRKRVATHLYNLSTPQRARCEKCQDFLNAVPESELNIVCKKGFLVKDIGFTYSMRKYTPVTQKFRIDHKDFWGVVEGKSARDVLDKYPDCIVRPATYRDEKEFDKTY